MLGVGCIVGCSYSGLINMDMYMQTRHHFRTRFLIGVGVIDSNSTFKRELKRGVSRNHVYQQLDFILKTFFLRKAIIYFSFNRANLKTKP